MDVSCVDVGLRGSNEEGRVSWYVGPVNFAGRRPSGFDETRKRARGAAGSFREIRCRTTLATTHGTGHVESARTWTEPKRLLAVLRIRPVGLS